MLHGPFYVGPMHTPQDFINSEYKKRKERNPNYSLRSFARWLNVSPAQLSQMMTGKRSITLKTMKKINDRLGLSPASSQDLVQTLLKQKNILQPDVIRTVKDLKEDEFRLVSDWYHLAILSLTKVRAAKSDPRWVARRLGIKVEDANQALLRLERMGLLELKPVFRQIGEPFEVISDVSSAAIQKYHKQNLGLAIEKVESTDVSVRQFQSITFPMNPALVKVLKKEIDEFLNRSFDKSQGPNPTEVYNLNVQLFPVTDMTKE